MTKLSSDVRHYSPVAKAAVVTVVAKCLARDIAEGGVRAGVARGAVDLCVAWVEGRLDGPARLSDAVYDAKDRGVLREAMEQPDVPAWAALATAVTYVAYHAYAAAGQAMPQDVAEVREDTLDLLVDQWRGAGSFDAGLLERAIAGVAPGAERVDFAAVERAVAG